MTTVNSDKVVCEGINAMTVAVLITISSSAQMLKNACPQCIEFYIFTFEAYNYVLIYSS
jgi:hypothetical protein